MNPNEAKYPELLDRHEVSGRRARQVYDAAIREETAAAGMM
jgi:hypothetical protein